MRVIWIPVVESLALQAGQLQTSLVRFCGLARQTSQVLTRVRLIVFDRKRRLIGCDRLLSLAFIRQKVTEIAVGVRIFGTETYRLTIFGFFFLRIGQDKTQIVMSQGVFRIEFDGLAVLGLLFLRICQRNAQIIVSHRKFWIELDGLAVFGYCFVTFAFSSQRDAQIVICVGIFRIDFNGLAILGNRFLALALPAQEQA